MSSNLAIIKKSLRLLGVISEAETPSAEQGDECLGHLNLMLNQWVEDGIVLGYFTQSSTTATCPIPEWSEAGVVSKLAQRLTGVYPASSLQPWVWNDNENGYGTIQRRTIVDSMEPSDMSHMPMGSGSFGRTTDITQG